MVFASAGCANCSPRCLPCPSTPLQSITAAASRSGPLTLVRHRASQKRGHDDDPVCLTCILPRPPSGSRMRRAQITSRFSSLRPKPNRDLFATPMVSNESDTPRGSLCLSREPKPLESGLGLPTWLQRFQFRHEVGSRETHGWQPGRACRVTILDRCNDRQRSPDRSRCASCRPPRPRAWQLDPGLSSRNEESLE